MICALVLTPHTTTLAWAAYTAVVGSAVWRSPWAGLFTERRRQHLLRTADPA
jgi:hypothetical protein